MFFVGIMGISSSVKQAVEVTSVCPLCGSQHRLNVARSYDYFHFFFIPLFKFNVQYFATCPGCASVFALSKELGDEIRAGRTTYVDSAGLQPIKNNLDGRCPYCGNRNPAGSAYCNRCGRAL